MKLVVIAWRNLWRNKRRTLITVSTIFFGVIICSLMGSMQEGSYNNMITNVVNFYSGYIQIHQKDYWDDKTINNSFVPDSQFVSGLGSEALVTNVIPRLESFALASSGELTKGVMVMGVDPEKENELTGIASKVIDGNYLKKDINGVLIGYKLAENLKLTENDTLVLFSQGYHGITAAGKYPVVGLFKQSNPKLNKQLVYMPLKLAQKLYGAENRLTAMVVMVDDNNKMHELLPVLKKKINSDYKVKSWEEMYPTMLQQIESDRSSGLVMKGILYIVILFGIFGTVMMMISERKREFGVMMAVGMLRYKLAFMVFVETLFIGILGVCAGYLGSMPVVGYFTNNPIPLTGNGAEWMADLGFEPYIFFAWEPMVFVNQAIVVMVITLFISAFPYLRIMRLNEMEALKG